MWNNILKLIDRETDKESIFEDLKKINGYDLWFRYSGFSKSVRYCRSRFKEAAGNAKLTSFPADGKTRIADYIPPRAWEARFGKIKIISPDIAFSLSYEKVPNSLFMYSYPTKKGGLLAEVVFLKGGDKKEDYNGVNVKGKIIFTYAYPAAVWRLAYEAGAIGILSSWKKGSGNGWVNYCFVPDSSKYKMFGFSLNEPEGRKLERFLLVEKKKGRKVTAKVEIDTTIYKGAGETVSAVIKGKTAGEVLVFAHLYEIGALDNASGSSAIIEIARCLNTLIKKGRLQKPKRSIRFMLGFECYSLMQYLLAKGERAGELVAGLNIDNVGVAISKKNPVNIKTTPDSNPAAANQLLAGMMKAYVKEKYGSSFVTVAEGRASDDSLPGDPCFGVQFPYIIQDPHIDDTWHNSIDRPDKISKETLKTSAAVSAAYLYFLANASSKEAVYLAGLSAAKGKEDIKFLAHAFKKQKIKNPGKLLLELKTQLDYRSDLGIKEVNSALRFADKNDTKTKELILKMGKAVKTAAVLEFNKIVLYFKKKTNSGILSGPEYKELTPLELEASRSIPVRLLPGLLTLETLPEKLKTKNPYGPQYQVTSIPYLWADGKRTLLDIYRLTKVKNKGTTLESLAAAFGFLEKHGYLKIKREKPVEVTKNMLHPAFKKGGIKKGDILLVHSSLSGLGHIKGGPKTVIAALQETVGQAGTVVMPAFSWSFPKNNSLPFDKNTSGSKVGIISEVFRRQNGVLRSASPTHSVSARGKYAAKIVNTEAALPPFDKNGPFGKLFELNAKVIFLGCGLHANSFLHAVEDWLNLPYLTSDLTHYYAGKTVKYKTFKKMPGGCRDFYSHTKKNPAKIYKLLFKAGIITEIKAGKGSIYTFELKKFVPACVTILKKDPLLLLCDKKECKFCAKFKK